MKRAAFAVIIKLYYGVYYRVSEFMAYGIETGFVVGSEREQSSVGYGIGIRVGCIAVKIIVVADDYFSVNAVKARAVKNIVIEVVCVVYS